MLLGLGDCKLILWLPLKLLPIIIPSDMGIEIAKLPEIALTKI
jgi:hypothetical protein